MAGLLKKLYGKLKTQKWLEPLKPAWRNFRRWIIARTTPLPKPPVEASKPLPAEPLDLYFERKLESFLARPSARIRFPQCRDPHVSIIILTFNKPALLLECLQSVANHTQGSYEVILADNASSDETSLLLDRIDGATILRNKENLDFIRGNNAACKHARGGYLLFLNHDTAVTPGWCEELSHVLDTRPEVGAVGSRLIHMDGRLQESGCLVRKDGSTWGYGRSHANPNDPAFMYVREVDFISGAGLMVRRELFEKLGGFDERYNPAYFEDADLCMGIKRLGYKVLIVPHSTILHRENGHISGRAYKLCQANYPKFREKFSTELNALGEDESVLEARDRRKGRNILVMDDYVPDPSRGAGMPRTRKMLLDLACLGHKVTYIPLTDASTHDATVKELQRQGIEIYHGRFDLTSLLEERTGFYDTVIVCKPHHAEPMLWRMLKYFPKAHLIYDTEAIIFQREMDRALIEGRSLDKDHLEDLKRREYSIMNQADSVIAVSEADRNTAMQGTRKPVHVYGFPMEIQKAPRGFFTRKNLLFVGGLTEAHIPNVDALEIFLKESWPGIHQQIPECQMLVVGANPCQRIQDAAGKGVRLLGRVEDLQEVYASARVVICPMRFGAGVPLKLAEAMAHGVPAVASPVAARGFGLEDGSVVAIAEDSQAFVRQVLSLYNQPREWEERQQAGLQFAQKHFSPEQVRNQLGMLLESFQGRNKRSAA